MSPMSVSLMHVCEFLEEWNFGVISKDVFETFPNFSSNWFKSI